MRYVGLIVLAILVSLGIVRANDAQADNSADKVKDVVLSSHSECQ